MEENNERANEIIKKPDKCIGCDYEHWCDKFGKSPNSRKRCDYNNLPL